ncbi:MAG TPA: hypothetical protein VFM59_06150 [Salinimicrobium sp.]|nr:hypothetical protein [Salinimicrobium sp.]
MERGEYFFGKVNVYVSSKKNLKKYGIHAILTKPEDLTINAIKKYLKVKSRGLL